MKLPRRSLLRLAAGAAALPAMSRIARAQTYPTRPVRIIVPFAPGGGYDAVARPVANRLSEVWGRQVFIENKSGAGGTVGAQSAAQSAPDGYTFFMGGNPLVNSQYIYPSLKYDPIRDFAPVTMVCTFPNLMVVPNTSGAKSVREFIDIAKAALVRVSFASSGVGTSVHLSGELFKRMAGIEMTHVPYRGMGPALNDLIPGRVDVLFGTMTGTWTQAQGGLIRALAVTSGSRSPLAPDIPTIAESGVPEFDVSAWYGLFAPAETPVEIVRKVHADAVSAIEHPTVRQRLNDIGAVGSPSSPGELSGYLKAEMVKWAPIIREAGIKPE
jgi:tripartite-type tricarboxylate transporter receptor subunit TctC